MDESHLQPLALLRGHHKALHLAGGHNVWSAGLRVQGARFKVPGAGFGVQDFRSKIRWLGFRVRDSGSGFGVRNSWLNVQGSWLEVWDSEFRV